jgi:hypothetical protein
MTKKNKEREESKYNKKCKSNYYIKFSPKIPGVARTNKLSRGKAGMSYG